MPKFYEVKGRIPVTGNPITDAKLLTKFQTEYDAFETGFVAAGGTLTMRPVTEKDKVAKTVPAAPPPQSAPMASEPEPQPVVTEHAPRHRGTAQAAE
jgi:hypothetical protein